MAIYADPEGGSMSIYLKDIAEMMNLKLMLFVRMNDFH